MIRKQKRKGMMTGEMRGEEEAIKGERGDEGRRERKHKDEEKMEG